MQRRDIMGNGASARMDDGNHHHFETFTRARSPGLQRMANRLCAGGGIDPEDLVQETLERAYQNFHRLADENTGAVIVWLSTTLKHRFLDHCRRRRTEVLGKPALRVVQDLEFSPEPMPVEQWAAVTTEQFRGAIDQLPEPWQTSYRLHSSGLRYREIARRMDAPEGTVGRWISEARQKLRALLGHGTPPDDGDPPDDRGAVS